MNIYEEGLKTLKRICNIFTVVISATAISFIFLIWYKSELDKPYLSIFLGWVTCIAINIILYFIIRNDIIRHVPEPEIVDDVEPLDAYIELPIGTIWRYKDKFAIITKVPEYANPITICEQCVLKNECQNRVEPTPKCLGITRSDKTNIYYKQYDKNY